MRYPYWAPVELQEAYEEGLRSLEESKTGPVNNAARNRYFRSLGYRNAVDYEQCLSDQVKVLHRLVLRPEMEAVWNWIVERHIPVSVMSYHGVVGRILRAMEDWVKANRSPDSERRADFREIARIASLLARKVRKYRGEIVGFHELPGLVSEEYEQVLSKFLHPDLVRQPKYSLRVYLRSFLPPIEDVLERMAARAKENSAALTSTFPKKIRAKSAYRTFIVRACTDITFSSTGCYSPSIVAALASVVLDDTGITADTVRKVAADLVGNAKGRAEDSAGKSGE